MNQPFYRAFEDRYRGTRDTIKARLRAYLPFLEALDPGPDAQALDLGCGRGEWLELLGELGFRARGIDLDDGMLAACRERGLDVDNQDALAALRAQPDGSLAVVSAFHLVEHIPFDVVRDVIREALRALRPGGLLIMETPNPENLVVGASDFYLDPSHLRPIPPNLLAFATEHGGFARHKVVRLQEDPQLRGGGRVALAAVLQGASPDYSVVAQKDAPAPVLARLDAAFGADYGIDMQQLASRYEAQRNEDHAEIHRNLGRIDADLSRNVHPALEQLRNQLHGEQAETRRALADAADKLAELARRVQAAEEAAASHAQRTADLLNSTSWRVTAPLRAVSALARRGVSAYRDGRLVSGARRRAKAAVRRAALAALSRPRVKHAALQVLNKLPGLRRRLQRLVRPDFAAAHAGPPADPLAASSADLPPRAARAYEALKRAQAAKQEQTAAQSARRSSQG